MSSARFVVGYAQALAKLVEPEIARVKPTNAKGQIVVTNHATYLFGHLSIYHVCVCEQLQSPVPDGLRAPQGWEDLFKAGAPCHHDPERAKYPV